MRIAHLLGWFYPEGVGGTEKYVAALARHQRSFGHHVSIAAPLAGLTGTRHDRHESFPVFRYGVPVRPTRAETQGLVPARGVEALHDWLQSIDADVVHVHSLVTGLSLHELAAARSTDARIVYTNHLPSLAFSCVRGNLMRWGTSPCDGIVERAKCAACALQKRGVPRSLAAWCARLPPGAARLAPPSILGPLSALARMPLYVERARESQRRLFDLADVVVVLNERAHECLLANGAPPAKLVVNRLGVDPSHVAARRPEKTAVSSPLTVAYVGRFDIDKGVLDLATAFSSLPAAAPIRLRFVGPLTADVGPVVKGIQGIVGDDRRVSIEAAVPPDTVGDILSAADVVCCPSAGFENGPTIALEAMAVGTPVIGTRVGALPEIVRDGVDGVLIEAGDVAGLAGTLQRLIADPAVILAWSRAIGPVRTMGNVAADYESIYPVPNRARTHAVARAR